jgi:hypothetical protein
MYVLQQEIVMQLKKFLFVMGALAAFNASAATWVDDRFSDLLITLPENTVAVQPKTIISGTVTYHGVNDPSAVDGYSVIYEIDSADCAAGKGYMTYTFLDSGPTNPWGDAFDLQGTTTADNIARTLCYNHQTGSAPLRRHATEQVRGIQR